MVYTGSTAYTHFIDDEIQWNFGRLSALSITSQNQVTDFKSGSEIILQVHHHFIIKYLPEPLIFKAKAAGVRVGVWAQTEACRAVVFSGHGHVV